MIMKSMEKINFRRANILNYLGSKIIRNFIILTKMNRAVIQIKSTATKGSINGEEIEQFV